MLSSYWFVRCKGLGVPSEKHVVLRKCYILFCFSRLRLAVGHLKGDKIANLYKLFTISTFAFAWLS